MSNKIKNLDVWPDSMRRVEAQQAKYPNVCPAGVTGSVISSEGTLFVSTATSQGSIVRLETSDDANNEATDLVNPLVFYFAYPGAVGIVAGVFGNEDDGPTPGSNVGDPDQITPSFRIKRTKDGITTKKKDFPKSFQDRNKIYSVFSNDIALIFALNRVQNEDELNTYPFGWPFSGCIAGCTPFTDVYAKASIVRASDLPSDEVINVMVSWSANTYDYPPETVAGQVSASMFQK
ncbi:hypothetical protein FAI40_05265 [Acetobacteraceae bacterium]|nr:hypothetical protein FAI40_05265 [Acetobacteraceae bacterium]